MKQFWWGLVVLLGAALFAAAIAYHGYCQQKGLERVAVGLRAVAVHLESGLVIGGESIGEGLESAGEDIKWGLELTGGS